MPSRTIALGSKGKAELITSITCGRSSPKLGGVVDISAFPNLKSFSCDLNDITAISGYENNSNLETLSFFSNQISTQLPSLDQLVNLKTFNCYRNIITGSLPDISKLTKIEIFNCYENGSSLSGQIPSLNGLFNLKIFQCYRNNHTGSIPSFKDLINLETFNCYENNLSGSIPILYYANKLKFFRCYFNNLSGEIPDLSNLTSLQVFNCEGNNLTSFAGGSISSTIQIMRIVNNPLSSSSMDAILTALVNTNTTNRTLYYGGTNSPPGPAGNNSLLTLASRGWNILFTPFVI